MSIGLFSGSGWLFLFWLCWRVRGLNLPGRGFLCLIVLVLNPALLFCSFSLRFCRLHRGCFEESFGCCSQVDYLLDDMAVEVGLVRYALYPGQAQRIDRLLGFVWRVVVVG
jgi:hypothetical protein